MIKKLAEKYFKQVVSLREELHQTPETDFGEVKTSRMIQSELDRLGISYVLAAKTGVVGLIKGEKEGKTLLLRADIDGLRISEETGLTFQSRHPGLMHACGHDVHTACLLGAARILNDLKSQFKGQVKLVFQPAEEGVGGAEPMIREGILENPPVDAAIALHVEPLAKVGQVLIKDGAIMACPDEFTLEITGRGGHGSAPHQCVNPIPVAAEIIWAYQTIVQRIISHTRPCVVSVCSIHGGACPNVIPDRLRMEGTVRALDYETREKIAVALAECADQIAKAAGAKCRFEYRKLYPPVVNDAAMNEQVKGSAEKLGLEICYLAHASMAGDDFSYIAQQVPSAYFRLGAGNDTLSYPLHSSKFNVDNQTILNGTALMAQIAFDYLTG